LTEPVKRITDFLRNQLTDYRIAARTDKDGVVWGNWVYPMSPKVPVEVGTTPLVFIIPIDESSERLGMGADDVICKMEFQIDVVAHGKVECSISGEIRKGQEVCDRIGRDIVIALRKEWRSNSDLEPVLVPELIQTRPFPYERDKGIFRRILRYRFIDFNTGE